MGRPRAEHLAIPKPGLDTHAYGRRKTPVCDAAMILCPKKLRGQSRRRKWVDVGCVGCLSN